MFSNFLLEADKKSAHSFIVYSQHITNTAQVRTASVHFIPCLLYVSCVRLRQHPQGVDCGLKRASGPCLLSCDWLVSRGPVDELDGDSKPQIAARQSSLFTPRLPQLLTHPSSSKFCDFVELEWAFFLHCISFHENNIWWKPYLFYTVLPSRPVLAWVMDLRTVVTKLLKQTQ